MRTQVNDLEEQLQRKHQQAAASVDSDLRTLQFDLAEKNKVRKANYTVIGEIFQGELIVQENRLLL